jgi:hypothetical protein
MLFIYGRKTQHFLIEPLYSILVLPLAPLLAQFASNRLKERVTTSFFSALLFICLLIVSPLVFTDYSYGGFYSYYFVFSLVLFLLLFTIYNFFRVRPVIRTGITAGLIILFIPFLAITFFARGFVGEDKIYDVKRIKGYKIVYKREADPVLTGPAKAVLYRTAVFRLLEKEIDVKYIDGNCAHVLLDNKNNRKFLYNRCSRTLARVD